MKAPLTYGPWIAASFEEIARALGSDVKTVQAAYYRALTKIRRRPDSARRLKELVELRASLRDRGASL